MKTERRHELQENELANWLGDLIQKIQPYSRVIVGVVVVAAALIFGTSYVNSRNLQADRAAWTAYYDAGSQGDPEALIQVAQSFPGSQASGWSMLSAADLLLSQGVEQSFKDRTQAAEKLASAKDTYQSVLDSFADDDALEQRAAFGLGKALESSGDLDGAKTQYQKIVDNWPNGDVAKSAQQRLDAVLEPRTAAWYGWFAEQEPPKSTLEDSSLFQDLPNLPAEPDINIPEPGQLLGLESSSSDASPDDTTPDDTSADDTSDSTSGAIELNFPAEQPAASDEGADAPELPEATEPPTDTPN